MSFWDEQDLVDGRRGNHGASHAAFKIGTWRACFEYYRGGDDLHGYARLRGPLCIPVALSELTKR